MTLSATDSVRLMVLSRLFSYPQDPPSRRDMEAVGLEDRYRWVEGKGEKGLEIIQNQYVRLFVNALPETPCVPFGSYYLEGTLMGTSTIRLKRMFGEYGFQVNELADHIAVELEFFALLSTVLDPVDAADHPVRRDYELIKGHLDSWAPIFFDRVDKNDETGY